MLNGRGNKMNPAMVCSNKIRRKFSSTLLPLLQDVIPEIQAIKYVADGK